MKYKVLFTAPTPAGELTEVAFSEVGETRTIGNYSVTLSKVLEEPAADHTGSAIVSKKSEFGKVTSESCTISKTGETKYTFYFVDADDNDLKEKTYEFHSLREAKEYAKRLLAEDCSNTDHIEISSDDITRLVVTYGRD